MGDLVGGARGEGGARGGVKEGGEEKGEAGGRDGTEGTERYIERLRGTVGPKGLTRRS